MKLLTHDFHCKFSYSGTPLLWTLWGPGKVSCIERCPHFRGKFLIRNGTQQSAWNTEVSLFQGCPLSGVPLYSVSAYAG